MTATITTIVEGNSLSLEHHTTNTDGYVDVIPNTDLMAWAADHPAVLRTHHSVGTNQAIAHLRNGATYVLVGSFFYVPDSGGAESILADARAAFMASLDEVAD